MSNKVEVQARNIRLTEKIEDYVKKKAGKLDHYLPVIEEARVELTHQKSARSAADRNVAQITVRGKGITLRTEERADEMLAAFDAALDNLQRQIERYKGKHYHGRGDGRSAAEVTEEEALVDETGELQPLIMRRKKFVVLPMNEEEAIEQMRLLGHDNFFIFYNGETNKINVLYRRRDGSYGLIEPGVG
ncbi:MAG: ribosomal subunit interface protein [Chloroflexi bacterium RBG_16_52_11]|nr:MAG: ribosomal subunit interface protein [Chloroflexi bacterium RBG_16_52_11]